MLKKIKPYIMPIAMVMGASFYSFFSILAVCTPYLIFSMLFLAYSKLDYNDLKFSKLHIWLVCIQLVAALSVYLIFQSFNFILAQGLMICFLAPTATAAPVITGMLQGNVASVTAYSLISNLMVAIVAPLAFSLIGTNQDMDFISSFLHILQPMSLLLLLPLITAFLLQKYVPSASKGVGTFSGLSFYLWCIALMIVTGKTVEFILLQSDGNFSTEFLIAGGALLICVFQFWLGRKLGSRFQNKVAGGQSLGQKNTVLAIWMAQMYLNPIASIGPGSYVLWQNIINSYQVWKSR
jgi:BASS family bile acid:Na+ symporter